MLAFIKAVRKTKRAFNNSNQEFDRLINQICYLLESQ